MENYMDMDMKLISDYRTDTEYFGMLDKLASATFGIALSEWNESGLLGSNYIPYSFIADGKIAANVSANIFTCEISGQTYQVVQLGTVMTDPAYRKLGLAGKLMRHVLSVYEKECLFIFLFANSSVLEFYPRFGFSRASQRKYVFRRTDLRLDLRPDRCPDPGRDLSPNLRPDLRTSFRPVYWENEADRKVIADIAGTRVPLSDSFGLIGDAPFRALFLSDQDNTGKLFYSEVLDAVAVMSREGKTLFVQDLFCRSGAQGKSRRAYMDRVLSSLPLTDAEQVECGFTMDSSFDNIAEDLLDDEADVLFMRSFHPLIMPGGQVIRPFDGTNEDRSEINLTGLQISHWDHT